MEIVHRLQQSTGIGTFIGSAIGAGAQDVDYCLTADGLVRFMDRI